MRSLAPVIKSNKLYAIFLIAFFHNVCIIKSFIVLPSSSTSSSSSRLVRHDRISSSWTTTSKYASKAVLQEGDNSDDRSYKIQILMSDTGGGHRASANAIRDAFDILYGKNKIIVDIVDIYTDYGKIWPYNAYVPIYKIMAEYTILWEIFFYFGATDLGMWLNEVLLEFSCFDSFKECLERDITNDDSNKRRADMVVSVHPLCQDLPCKILSYLDNNGTTRDKDKRTTPFVTVVTDLGGAHPSWFYPDVDKCFVPSDALYNLAVDRELNDDQLIMHGLPIRKGFWSSSSSSNDDNDDDDVIDTSSTQKKNWFDNIIPKFGKASETASATATTVKSKNDNNSISLLKKSLELDESIPTILIVGGGDGMGKIVDVTTTLASKLSQSQDNYQIVVVCGKNERAQKELQTKEYSNNLNMIIKGFVYNMEDWMKCSDVLITKAGPGTIAEASICALPCMLSSYLPGQEEGNVPFVIDNNFGDYSSDTNKIAHVVSDWLANPEKLQEMKEAALLVARPDATLDIAKDLATIVFQHCDGNSNNNKS